MSDTSFQVNLQTASVRRQVENQLRQAITQGVFEPGGHLSDRALQERFGVSRTVVREAMRQLEAEGLIETIPHRGSFVKKLSPAEARQVYDVRGVLEALAARGFARCGTAEQLERLQSAFDELKGSIDSADGVELIAVKQRFYGVLLEGCGNVHVRRMLNQILNQNSQLRRTSMSDPERLPHTVAELEVLMDALRRRDEEVAWTASLNHVRNAASVALKILEESADDEPAEIPHEIHGKRGVRE